MLEVHRVVRAKAEAVGAVAWLRGLAGLVASLESEWGIHVGVAFDGGTEAYVAAATLGDGTAAVLKLVVPRRSGDADDEIAVLRHCAGEGCVLLLRDDPGRGALLLERLGPSLYDLGVPVEEHHEILCAKRRVRSGVPPQASGCRRGLERRVGWRRGFSGPGRASAGRAAWRRSSTR